jgi:soluble lytic murein transglycosylase
VGDWGRAYNLANRNQIQLATLSPARANALLYPLAYATEVRAAADAMGIDPAFIWAIMRRESAFDPTVTSPAHALGLMQMLVPTAGRIASLLGQAQRPVREQLYDPSVELPYAAWYLAELWGRFGHVGLAAAGYNAGPRAVASWVRDRGDLPFDEFVEAIPYRETRLYVKNVLADYLAYRALYPTQAPLGPLPDRLDRPRPGVGF